MAHQRTCHYVLQLVTEMCPVDTVFAILDMIISQIVLCSHFVVSVIELGGDGTVVFILHISKDEV